MLFVVQTVHEYTYLLEGKLDKHFLRQIPYTNISNAEDYASKTYILQKSQ
jgi:hypothetical protein